MANFLVNHWVSEENAFAGRSNKWSRLFCWTLDEVLLVKWSSQVGTKTLVGTFVQKQSGVGGATGGIVSVGGKERERVESTWKVFRLRGNAGRIQALTTTNGRNLTRQQISEPHTWTCGGPDLNTAACGSRMTLLLFWPPVRWGWEVDGGEGVRTGGGSKV